MRFYKTTSGYVIDTDGFPSHWKSAYYKAINAYSLKRMDEVEYSSFWQSLLKYIFPHTMSRSKIVKTNIFIILHDISLKILRDSGMCSSNSAGDPEEIFRYLKRSLPSGQGVVFIETDTDSYLDDLASNKIDWLGYFSSYRDWVDYTNCYYDSIGSAIKSALESKGAKRDSGVIVSLVPWGEDFTIALPTSFILVRNNQNEG